MPELFNRILEHSVDKRRIAGLLQRAPWVGYAAQRVYRIWQPWVTIGAVGAIFNTHGQLLIVEHVFHPKFPWGLPGGWMARNEEPEETVRREVREETGLAVITVRPLAITRTKFLPQHLDVAYLCRLMPEAENTQIRLSDELLAYKWIDPSDASQVPPMAHFHARVIKQALVDRGVVTR
jgi:ADP-ribose pyrophosphatase YjhB (NUDIX family)